MHSINMNTTHFGKNIYQSFKTKKMQLSIITINYNNKIGLQKTIDSVITQTFKDFEWIIIDGGSTDGSKELIEEYSQYITYWVSEPDKGIYNAMNKGILQAKGEYLYFLNSGDYLVNAYCINKIFSKNNKEDIICGNLILLSNPNRKDYNLHSNYITCYDLIKWNLNHQSTFIRKKLFVKHGLYDENLYIVSDWKFFLYTIIFKEASVKYFNIDIAYFDITGISKQNNHLLKKEREKVLSDYFPRKVLEDYNFTIQFNEIRKYKLCRIFFSIIYRITILYERYKFPDKFLPYT